MRIFIALSLIVLTSACADKPGLGCLVETKAFSECYQVPADTLEEDIKEFAKLCEDGGDESVPTCEGLNGFQLCTITDADGLYFVKQAKLTQEEFEVDCSSR